MLLRVELLQTYLKSLLFILCLMFVFLSFYTGTSSANQSNTKALTLLLLPSETATSLYERFLPIKRQLEVAVGQPVSLRIARDYLSAINELGRGTVDMALLDPAMYCEARARFGKRITPMVKAIKKSHAHTSGVVVAKKQSDIEKLIDAKGKRLALGSESSTFSYLAQMSMFKEIGLTDKDFKSVDYLMQEDRIALSVLIGEHDIGAISSTVADKYLNDGLKIIKKSEPLPAFVIVASYKMPKDLTFKATQALTNIKDPSHLRSIDKNLNGFVQAEDRDFDVVRVMIKNLTGRDYIEYSKKTLKVAVLPLYSTITLYERYDPLMKYLTKHTGYEFKLFVPTDFEDFIKVIKDGKVEFSYQNPYIYTLLAKEKLLIPLVTTVGEDTLQSSTGSQSDKFRGVIITRVDSPIKTIADIKGKKALITSFKSAGGFLSQQIFLRQHGIDVYKDLKLIDAKRQENVILGVYRGEADVGFVRESALVVWKDVVDMNKIRILQHTTYLPNWPLSATDKAPAHIAEQVKKLLINLKDKEVLSSAKVSGFKPANLQDFEILKRY